MKFITCVVPRENRSRFSIGQEAWAALADVDGFVAQTGGWSCGDDNLAVIVAFWESADAYESFVQEVHDVIFESNGQEGSFGETSVALFEDVFDVPGSSSSIREAALLGDFVRIADCHIERDRVDHFLDVQETFWKQGIGETAGMLGGVLARGRDDRLRYLVSTFWKSEDPHTRYRKGVFSSLRERAVPDSDCLSLSGTLVHVVPSWRVVSE